MLYFTSVSQAHCSSYRANDGMIYFEVAGGVQPYYYNIGGDWQEDDGSFYNLPAGQYILMAQDSLGETVTNIYLEITQPPAPTPPIYYHVQIDASVYHSRIIGTIQ